MYHFRKAAEFAHANLFQVLSQHQTQKHFPPDLAVNAASRALHQGDTYHAVELLKQGRALHWTQIAHFHTSLEHLYSEDPSKEALVRQFQNLSTLLNRHAEVPFTHDTSRIEMEAREWHYRNLLRQWNKVVGEIRTLKGFSCFLLPPLFADLQEAACKGPIIVLVASKFSCDAIIVLHVESPIHLQLKITLEELNNLVSQHHKNNQHPEPGYKVFVEVMRKLWKRVIFPVVQQLKGCVAKHSRIWWCPHHSSLHFHYTVQARTRNAKMTQEITFAAIGQATPDTPDTSVKAPALYYIDCELDDIEKLLPIPSVMFTKLMGSEATRDQALQMLVDNQWLHLSCHGVQVPEKPFDSHLAMADGSVSLLDIINANISSHEFAFLSACEAAMGDLSTPDEVIHLAAGLQFMGVKSVIGTLWRVHDDVAYKVVMAFYKEFCKNRTLDCTMAARALHEAVATLAKDGVPVQERAMFVHIGI
ncbi:CHAT domain-containing protein [Melanogaster broomeanus]|nr:CHAT domain-containing protein [Melanogaster broomeanus]